MTKLAYVNGTFCDPADAKVSIEDRGFQFGDGVYEVVVSYDNKLFLLDRHLARLRRSLEAIDLRGKLRYLRLRFVEDGAGPIDDIYVWIKLDGRQLNTVQPVIRARVFQPQVDLGEQLLIGGVRAPAAQPITPSRTARVASACPVAQRNSVPSMCTMPACSAAASILSPSSALRAKGFSQSTCLPATMERMDHSRCMPLGSEI